MNRLNLFQLVKYEIKVKHFDEFVLKTLSMMCLILAIQLKMSVSYIYFDCSQSRKVNKCKVHENFVSENSKLLALLWFKSSSMAVGETRTSYQTCDKY